MTHLLRGLLAAVLTLALAAPAALGATYTVRVEGQDRTLLARTTVTVPDGGQVPGVAQGCDWNEPAGPLHAATNGDWDRSDFVKTILGETHAFENDDSWSLWVDGKWGGGACLQTLTGGEDILFVGGQYDENFNARDLPLMLSGVPARVAAGEPFTVTVTEPVPDRDPQFNGFVSGTGTPRPAQGATVSVAGVSATTGADGRATLSVAASGQFTVQATRGTAPSRSEAVPVCVGCDPAQPVPGATGSTGTAGDDAGRQGGSPSAPGPDRSAPPTRIAGIREGRRFRRGRGPRVLRGTAGRLRLGGTDPSGILMVKLRLTRRVGPRCFMWSARRERFVRAPCGVERATFFRIGDKPEWEYQLPRRLPRGRYVLDAYAVDKALNRDIARRRGQNRVVFHVR